MRARLVKGKRNRRSGEELEQMITQVTDYIKAHPGQGLEQIGVGLGTATSELKRPVAKLVQARSLKTTGQKRGTKYFIAGRGKTVAAKVGSKRKSKRARKAKAT